MITDDAWTLSIVQEGLKLQFVNIPPRSGVRITNFVNMQKNICILEEVQSLLEKHAIEHVPKDQEGQGYYSTFFIVPKKDGGFRPILNLRELNTYLKVPHFKMETLKTIICALEQNDWALSMDLKDAYLHVAVFPPHRKYLRFCIMGNHYQFRAMPFGLAVAPRIFTKLMAVIGSYLRAREIQIYMYLDDWLIKNQNREILVNQSRMVLQLIERLGLIVNHAKSHLEPSQVIQYLGAVFNLQEGMIYPTLERCTKIQEEIRLLMSQTHQTAQLFLHVLGLMASCIDLTPLARLHMRPIQFYTLSFWRPHKDSLFHVIPVQDTLIQHLKWWQDCNNIMAGTPLRQSHSIVLWTDASQMGWGAHMEDNQVSGTWTVQEKEQHINWLEMKAVQQALIHFRHILLGKKVLLRCDNSTVVSHINKQGGDKVLSPMLPNVGDISVGSEEQGQSEGGPHSRKKECLSGRLVQRQKGSKTDGMELRSGNSITHFPEIYDSQFGPVCDEGEQEVASVLLALSRSASIGNRCSKCRLEEHLCLCLSTSNHNSAGSEKGTTATVHSDIDCPIGTQTVMVPQSAGTSHRLSKEATSARKDVNAKKGSSRSRRSRKSKPCGLENIRVSEPTPRFSKRARDYIKQARRVSTRKLYDARLSIYRGWCDEQSVSATSASIEEIANFFVYLHEVRKCKATTIAGYRSAIASIHKGIAGTSVSQDKTLSSLIKGIFNSDPDLRPLLPNWDLPSVLGALVASPFEPLSTCDMKYLTWKTVFLLALATASRVSELHALSVNENNLRVDNSGIRLLPNLQFLAKTQRVNKAWKPYFIPIFDSYASDPEDILLCPCRALRIYLDRTRSLRGNVDNLFLTYQKGLCKAAAKSSLSRWIVLLIRYVYEDLPHGPLFNVRAHDTRRLSASWALFNGASIQDILQAAHWAAETTFTSFYLKDVVWNEDRFARASVLETAQWARRSRSCHQNRQ